jgi:hypothetical protein
LLNSDKNVFGKLIHNMALGEISQLQEACLVELGGTSL